ncbi:GNAT family N-acetyltransferase, partial [Leucobacter sp. M11]|uniref:GNAT family N-acetyltransferase n=1 Tax=Leucobacter sp. M11 TaxID=2993565 RepID=UPI002D80FE1B
DAPEVWAYQSDPEVLRYIPWPERSPEEAAEHTLRRAANRVLAADGDTVFLAVVPTVGEHAGRVVGDVMLRLEHRDAARVEMGWVFAAEAQGRGYALEACSAVRDLALDTLGAAKLVAHLDPRNTASARLCARLGMRPEGLARQEEADDVRGEWTDLSLWGMVAADRGLSPVALPEPAADATLGPDPRGRPGLPADAEARLDRGSLSERLRLRPLRPADAADLWHLQRDPEVRRFLTWPARTEAEGAAETRRRAGLTRLREPRDLRTFVAELTAGPDAGRVIGQLRLQLLDPEAPSFEVGWVFSSAFRGRGYAGEAARALFRLAFEDLGAHRLVARLDTRNTASAALCARLGMRREALLRAQQWHRPTPERSEWADLAMYAILAPEWQAGAAQR